MAGAATVTPDRIMQLGLGFWGSKTLLSAIELGLFSELARKPLNAGGFDYTGKDCSDWMRAAGFRDTRVEHLAGPDSMVIGIK